MRMTDKYVFFWGRGCSFTNWHPCEFEVDGVRYNCSEQFLMAEKARMFNDTDTLREILASSDPRYQKACGRSVRGFNKGAWDAKARDIMYRGCHAKYSQNPDLKKELLSTGTRTIVEASPEDCIWGIGIHWKSELCDDPKNWRGTNWLGETLTKVRDDLAMNERGVA